MTTRNSFDFLFTTLDGGGNVAPLMVAVEGLLARGHRVRVMSDGSSRAEIEHAGARFVPWTRAPNQPERMRDTSFGDWSFGSFAEVIEHLLAPWMCGQALSYAQDVMAELDREPADLVVNFDMTLGVVTGCEAQDQKLALLSTCIAHVPFALAGVPPFGTGLAPPTTAAEASEQQRIAREQERLLDTGLGALNAARAQLGLGPLAHVADQVRAVHMRFLGTAQAFDFAPTTLPANVRYVGPLVRDPVWVEPWSSPWPAADARPLVLVGFSSSFQNHAACLQRVIDACAELPVRVLVTLGGSIDRQELDARANTVIVESAPHGVVMREASLVVTHGGHGTVMTALMHRLPMLVLPHGRDQGDNAARISERGAGLSLPNTASAAEIRGALARLLEDQRFKAAARNLGDAVAREVSQSTLLGDLEVLASSSVRSGTCT